MYFPVSFEIGKHGKAFSLSSGLFYPKWELSFGSSNLGSHKGHDNVIMFSFNSHDTSLKVKLSFFTST